MRGRLTAASVSMLAHASVAAAFVIGLPMRAPPGTVDKGLHGIEVSLSAGGMSAPEPVAVQAAEPPPPPPEPEPEIVTSKDPAPEIAKIPEPALQPKPRAEPKQKPVQEKAAPKPVTRPVEVPRSEMPAEPVREVTAAAVAAPAPTARVGDRNLPGTGNGAARSSGGNPGAEADYFAILSAWLERHKEYPWRAQRRHSEGVAYLQFVVGRDGRVLQHSIRRSSGHPILDDAVERMIKQAEPLPPIPAELGRDRMEIVVPVEFYLK